MMALIPVVAISPILLYIGMLIGAQAFQETPKQHAPAIVLALIPHIAAWGKLQIDSRSAQPAPARRRRLRQARPGRNLVPGPCGVGGGRFSAGCALARSRCS
jgi:AGZA family xanthine/uracil permease-like MFS transporter